jgi:hypothetical protein
VRYSAFGGNDCAKNEIPFRLQTWSRMKFVVKRFHARICRDIFALFLDSWSRGVVILSPGKGTRDMLR